MTISDLCSDESCEVVGIILAAGSGRRMKAGINKVWLPLHGKSVLERSIDTFRSSGRIRHLVIVGSKAEFPDFTNFLETKAYREEVSFVAGGNERQDSVANALRFLKEWPGWTAQSSGARRRLVAIHDAARPLLTVDLINRGIEAALEYRAIGLAVPVKDTIKQVDGAQLVLHTPERTGLWAMQTPQIFDYELIASCYERIAGTGQIFSDDCGVVESAGYPVKLIQSSYRNLKITTPEDIRIAESFMESNDSERGGRSMRVGQGFDVHRLVSGRRLVLGGVAVPYELGLLGHSDADVLIHAIMDALLGAIGAGDIGGHFPDSDAAYRNVDSTQLLATVRGLVQAAGYRIINLDSTIVAQKPKLADFIPAMRQRLAGILGITLERVSVKATTTEKLGFTGRGEGIAAQAIVLLERDL